MCIAVGSLFLFQCCFSAVHLGVAAEWLHLPIQVPFLGGSQPPLSLLACLCGS